VVMEKIAKLFPAYLMNPANRETFHPRNFCRLRYPPEISELKYLQYALISYKNVPFFK